MKWTLQTLAVLSGLLSMTACHNDKEPETPEAIENDSATEDAGEKVDEAAEDAADEAEDAADEAEDAAEDVSN